MTIEISNSSQYTAQRLADLTETLEKEKVELTPEVEEYVRAHVRAVQDKLQAGEPIFESDLAFIDKVKVWVLMPEEWREKFESVEKMEEEKSEADKRLISLNQWLALLHMAKVSGKQREWIDGRFIFSRRGIISSKMNLHLGGCESLTYLPENLRLENLNIIGCTSLKSLPAGLKVKNSVCLKDCTSLESLPEDFETENLDLEGCTALKRLPENFRRIGILDLNDCTSLESLPEGLKVEYFLNLEGCTSLTTLPGNLEVGNDLYLSSDMNKQVKEAAERLKREGKIKDEVKYDLYHER
jgi:hypothetical protein